MDCRDAVIHGVQASVRLLQDGNTIQRLPSHLIRLVAYDQCCGTEMPTTISGRTATGVDRAEMTGFVHVCVPAQLAGTHKHSHHHSVCAEWAEFDCSSQTELLQAFSNSHQLSQAA